MKPIAWQIEVLARFGRVQIRQSDPDPFRLIGPQLARLSSLTKAA